MSDTPPEGLTPPGPGMDPPEPAKPDSTATTTPRPPAPVQRYDPGTSRKLAGWALALSLLFCIPFAFLVAIGLAIAALVRGGDGRDHGKGMAIAALVISGLLVIANVAYVVVVVFDGIDTTERDEEGRVVDGGTVTLDKLRVGDCYNEPKLDDLPDDGSEGQASGSVAVVPCADDHQAEVFHVIRLELDDYPGQPALDRRSRDCFPVFKDYVGVPYRKSRYDFVMYFPTSMTWRLGDRTILCSLTLPDASKITGSVRDSKE